MFRINPLLLIYKAILVFFIIHCFLAARPLFAQLSSVEVSGGISAIKNPSFNFNGSSDLNIRFNQRIGYFFSLNVALGMNHTRFTSLSDIDNSLMNVSNRYTLLQAGLNFNILTAIKEMGWKGQTCKGNKAILFSNFKWYLCSGLEYLHLNKSTDARSYTHVSNLYIGTGFDLFRFGRNAHQNYSAFVPFMEARYYTNISKGYIAAAIGNSAFSKATISFGIKYTFHKDNESFNWK